MLIVDHKHSGQEIRTFASKLPAIVDPSDFAKVVQFNGDQTPDFYYGLLSGLAAAYALAANHLPAMIGPTIAFVADQIERREIVPSDQGKSRPD